jgi:hypothetical protein
MPAFHLAKMVKDQPILARCRMRGATVSIVAGGRQIESQFVGKAQSEQVRTPDIEAPAWLFPGAGNDANMTVSPDGEETVVDFKNARLESVLSSARRCKAKNLPTEQKRVISRVETQNQETPLGRTVICGLQRSLSKYRVSSSQKLIGKFLPCVSKSFAKELIQVVATPPAISGSSCSASGIPFHPRTRRPSVVRRDP